MPTAYVDGSYRGKKKLGCGAVMYAGSCVSLFSQTIRGPIAKGKSVAAELAAAAMLINYCMEKSITEVVICYDCMCVQHFTETRSKNENPIIDAYYEFVNEARKTVKLHFVKVKAHSKDIHNRLADEMANIAA